MIIEDEQQGQKRAEYGKSIVKELSIRLTDKFGKGFSFVGRQVRFTSISRKAFFGHHHVANAATSCICHTFHAHPEYAEG